MKIDVFIWDSRNVAHVSRHWIDKEEVEEVLERFHQVRKVWKGRYAVRGHTYAGRYLMIFVDDLGQGRAYVVTAREMTEQEKSRFRRSL